MTKKKVKPVKKYKVMRGIQRDDVYRFEAGDIITAPDLHGAPIERWLETGVLEEVE
jgi:hypothetical protein